MSDIKQTQTPNVKQTIANLLGAGLVSVSRVNPTIGGKLGKAIDIVGQALGNPLPQAQGYGPQGATGYVESVGGVKKEERIQQRKDLTQYEKDKLKEELDKKATERAGFSSAKSKSSDTSGKITPDEALKKGWDINELRKKGLLAELTSSNSSGPSPDQAVRNASSVLSTRPDIARNLDDASLNAALSEYVEKGGDIADIMERKARENAERRYGATLELLREQKGEIGRTAREQRETIGTQSEFYKGEFEKKRQRELEDIEAQKQAGERQYLENKDLISRSFRDATKKFEAQARASNIPISSFLTGEQRKLLNELNSNLAQASLKHQDFLGEMSKAVIRTNEIYDSRIAELDMKAREDLREIDRWERQRILDIQGQEKMALVDKLEAIENATSQAEALRKQVEMEAAKIKVSWAQWLAQVKVQEALAVKYAAQDNVTKASDLLREVNMAADAAKKTIGMGWGERVQDETGNFYWNVKLPTGKEASFYMGDNEEEVEQKISNIQKLYQKTDPIKNRLSEYLSNQ